MKKIILKNIDNDTEVLTYTTSKRSDSTIQDELLNKIQEQFNHRPIMQGTYSFTHRENNRLTVGGALWWLVGGCDGRLQYVVLDS